MAVTAGLWLIGTAGAGAQTYSFSTMAGDPTAFGSHGWGEYADGTNSSARFASPVGVAVNGSGDIFVGDTMNHMLRKITALGNDWVVTTIAGAPDNAPARDGTNSSARFQFPYGIAVDGAGNIYVAEGNNDIRLVTPVDTNWVVTTVAGSSTPGTNDGVGSSAAFSSPNGIAVDAATNLFVADTGNNTIRKITRVGADWVVSTIAGSPRVVGAADGMNGSASFNGPSSIAVDRSGNIFVSDGNGGLNRTIRKITASGANWEVTTLAGLASTSGTDDGPGTTARFSAIGGLVVDGDGVLLVTDNQMIRRVTYSGNSCVVTTVAGKAGEWGSDDGSASEVRFCDPYNLAADQGHNLYIADTDNMLVRRGFYIPGVLPALQISCSGSDLVLSWPASAAGFEAETSESGAPPWTRLTNAAVVVGESFVLTNSPGTTKLFYRLHKH
jgi:hypothetical protein